MRSRTSPALPLLAAALWLASPAARAAETCPVQPSWPTEGWTSRSAEVATSRAAEIKALEDYEFTLEGADADRKGRRTDGMVIIHHGQLIYEKYARGFDETKRHLSWSVSKSITNMLVGIAVSKGALTIDDTVCTYVKLDRTENCGITVRNLLEFSSGLDWKEAYENESNQVSSVLAMLYGEGQKDMAAFVGNHKRRDEPGTTYMYSTGDTMFLAGVLDAAIKPKTDPAYPWTYLFTPLGMKSATFERDGRGVIVGSSYFYATPRDMAKLGYFLLNDGCWAGTRILPDGWVSTSIQPSAPFKLRPLGTEPDDVQGWQFWLNRPVPEQNVSTPWPDVPQDAYAARGHWGQSITVIPSLDLIVVRVADDRDGSNDHDKMLSLAMAVAR